MIMLLQVSTKNDQNKNVSIYEANDISQKDV